MEWTEWGIRKITDLTLRAGEGSAIKNEKTSNDRPWIMIKFRGKSLGKLTSSHNTDCPGFNV
jgi:hypothetical protein